MLGSSSDRIPHRNKHGPNPRIMQYRADKLLDGMPDRLTLSALPTLRDERVILRGRVIMRSALTMRPSNALFGIESAFVPGQWTRTIAATAPSTVTR